MNRRVFIGAALGAAAVPAGDRWRVPAGQTIEPYRASARFTVTNEGATGVGAWRATA